MNQQQRDIEEERSRASFPVRKMTYYLNGGEAITHQIEKVRALVEADPIFDRQDEYFLSNPEKYRRGLEKFKRVRELLGGGQLDHLSKNEKLIFEQHAIPYHAMSLHQYMFLPTLRGQADDEQLEKWLPLAENYDIVGCYAQTELGHGSNVRGLETTATFDAETDEIVLNSPTLTSTKWWPGALGKTANHAIVHARLLLPEADRGQPPKDMGVHAFLVQIRDLKTHRNMPGVKTGMIGPRYGTNVNDNGFMRLDHVRVPRRNMMMRYTRLDRDGTYSLANKKATQLNYGTMLYIRAGIVQGAGKSISSAATVAVRYSSIRRQFPSAGDEGADDASSSSSSSDDASAAASAAPLEQKVLDYQAQQYRIFPHLANSYALFATGRDMHELYQSLQQGIKSNNFEALPEAHATSSGLKAVTTMLASEGIEECRKALGGHGYLLNSGLGELFTGYVSNNTLEGENYLIIQQLSRYLIKTLIGAAKGQPAVGNATYLNVFAKRQMLPLAITRAEDLLVAENQLTAYANRAGYLVAQAVTRMQAAMKEGKSFAQAFQTVQWTAIRAAKAHCMYSILQSSVKGVERAKTQHPELYPPLKDLLDLFALYHTEKELGEFLEASQYSPTQAGWIHEQVEAAMRRIRPNAVALVDAFNYSDRDLNSALGRYDGNAYEALFEWTKKDPMNQTDVIPCYEEVIRPIVTKEFAKAPPSKL